MKRQGTMQAHQLETFARFLGEHPGFSPLLMGEDALVCGFQVGGSYLRIEEMERLIATRRSSMLKRRRFYWLRRAYSEQPACDGNPGKDSLIPALWAPKFNLRGTERKLR